MPPPPEASSAAEAVLTAAAVPDTWRVRRAKSTVYLVDAMTLTRECVGQALHAGARDFAVTAIAQVEEVTPGGAADVILLNVHATPMSDPWVAATVAEIRRRTEAPIVILSGVRDQTEALRAVSSGLRGFVPATVDMGMLIAALRLVLAGGTFIPQDMVTDYARKASEVAHVDGNDVMFLGFTPREAEVIRKLREGKLNKTIAYELNISESTVKIHVRHIMRKLNATNRTQVVCLVQNRGDAK